MKSHRSWKETLIKKRNSIISRVLKKRKSSFRDKFPKNRSNKRVGTGKKTIKRKTSKSRKKNVRPSQ